jgi:tRNA (Thr-GGU) A37 N-methylase
MGFLLHLIGIIHSPFTDKSQTPIQTSHSQARRVVEVYTGN